MATHNQQEYGPVERPSVGVGWERYGGLAGIVAAVLVGVAVRVQPSTDPSQPASVVVNHLLVHRSGELAGVYLQLAAALPLLIFTGALASTLRCGDQFSRQLGALTLVAGVMTVALVLAAQEMLGTLVAMTLGTDAPEVTRGVYAAFRGVFTASFYVLGVFVAAAGLGIAISRLLPRWLGWLGLASGIFSLLGGFSFATWHGPLELLAFLGLLLTLLWMVLTGIWLLRGGVAARIAGAPEGTTALRERMSGEAR